MAGVMIFEEKATEKIREEMVHFGIDGYCTGNIFDFLRYAKELKPDLAILRFSKDFQNTKMIFQELKEALCEKKKCPKIYLNPPKDFEGEIFFESIRFRDRVYPSSILRKIKNKQKYLN